MAGKEIFSDHGIDIPSGASGQIKTLCPKCSEFRKNAKDKCLSVEIPKGIWNCHHCGYSGNLKEEKVEYNKPKYSEKPDLPEKVIKWFADRKIPSEILIKNKIGYGKSFSDASAIQFPYIKGGEVVNIKHRTSDKRFRQEKNAEKCLYRFDEIAKHESDSLIITEGEVDALSFQVAKFNMVTSIPDGAPSENAKQFHTKFDFLNSSSDIIQKYKKIVLAVDNDTPGKLVEQELARRIGAEKCYRVEYPEGCKDGNDVLVKYGWEKLREIAINAKPFPVEGLFTAYDFKDEVLSLYKLGENRGKSTGWINLNEYYTVKLGEFSVITGMPGAGKSTFMDALVVNMVKEHDWKFLFFSPESWPVQRHLQSLLEKVEGLPFAKDGRFSKRMAEDDIEGTLQVISKYFFFIYPEENMLSVDEILSKAKAAIFRHGINGVIIDPWNEVDHLYQNMTEAQYLSKALSKIRQFAKKNHIHIWVIAHPKNLVKDTDGSYRPPTMYEISGGAQWRNKADNGLCLHRPDYIRDETDVIIQKIRFREVGKVGKVTLKYLCDTGEYREADEIQDI